MRVIGQRRPLDLEQQSDGVATQIRLDGVSGEADLYVANPQGPQQGNEAGLHVALAPAGVKQVAGQGQVLGREVVGHGRMECRPELRHCRGLAGRTLPRSDIAWGAKRAAAVTASGLRPAAGRE